MKCQVVLSFTTIEDAIFASTLRSLINGDTRLFLSWKKSILRINFHVIDLKLKAVAFIAGKSENPAALNRFSIDNLIASMSLYALSWSKLNFGCYLTFEIIFKL